MSRLALLSVACATAALSLTACERSEPDADGATIITFSGSAVGTEGEVVAAQLERFMERHPDIRVVQRRTPDAADQRHQLYVQWLNAGVGEPDILQLDVIWTAEFAAAGWILPLDRFQPDVADFFPATLKAARWQGTLYALPWFADVGMLYWRTDLLDHPPTTLPELASQARAGRQAAGLKYGYVWQGARYEGLVCVFLEHLGAFGGRILDADRDVAVDSGQAIEALRFMRDALGEGGIVPESVLTWREEQVRFAFQNGQAVFMRNWPYAYALMQDADQSRVAGKFAVAPLPATHGGSPTSALGGAQLAINTHSKNPQAAYAVIEFLTQPAQMLERSRLIGQFPPRQSLYEGDELDEALAVPAKEAREIITHAEPRPVTPLYAQLSELLQIQLHRALTGQAEPEQALAEAARELRALLKAHDLQESQHAPSP
jgi:multiple sugar transport system substrate-binding protein